MIFSPLSSPSFPSLSLSRSFLRFCLFFFLYVFYFLLAFPWIIYLSLNECDKKRKMHFDSVCFTRRNTNYNPFAYRSCADLRSHSECAPYILPFAFCLLLYMPAHPPIYQLHRALLRTFRQVFQASTKRTVLRTGL